MSNKILVCIFNYRNDENARKWLEILSPHFDTYVLDSGNDKVNTDFIQFPNIYYSGLFNEFKKLFERGEYTWGGIICSDVTIADDEIQKFINRVYWLNSTSNVGIWQPSPDESSRSVHGHVTYNEKFQYKLWLEGWLLFMKDDVVKKMPYVDDSNTYGWNIDIVSEIISHDFGFLNIMDNRCIVHHPAERGYPETPAREQGRLWEKNTLAKLGLTKPCDTDIIKKEITYSDNKDITFVIPNRGGDKNLDIVINNFTETFGKQFDKIYFIVIEQCDDYPFMRGQLYNISLDFIFTNYISLIDNDIYNINEFNIIETYKKFGKPFVAFNEISQLTLKGNNSSYIINKTEKRLNGFGAFNVFKRSDFEQFGGFSNLCIGWGAEDNILNEKIHFERLTSNLGHIEHPRRVNLNPESTAYNREVFEMYKNNKLAPEYDGYKQTTYNLVYQRVEKNVSYIGVNNISVVKDYLYNTIYNKARTIAKIPQVTIGKEKLIVTLTSWKKRVGNLPVVLDSIFAQTKVPDRIVVNLSTEEFPNQLESLPEETCNYLNKHRDKIQINWVDGVNTKQWKKILPTLKLYPNDCIVCIDDDFIYPNDMLKTLWNAHLEHPNNPISGNTIKFNGYQCHCGCASLVKLEYFPNIFNYITQEIQKMHSSDIFFTYVATKAGHPYIFCGKRYFMNMKTYNETNALHSLSSASNSLVTMWKYLIQTYGNISITNNTKSYQTRKIGKFYASNINLFL